MIDDAKIRRMLLERFPQIDVHRFAMEDFGDDVGVWWLKDNVPLRARVKARAGYSERGEQELADQLAALMEPWFAPAAPEQPFRRGPGRPRKIVA